MEQRTDREKIDALEYNLKASLKREQSLRAELTRYRAVMEQAVEALAYYQHRDIEWEYSDDVALTALRECLKEVLHECNESEDVS